MALDVVGNAWVALFFVCHRQRVDRLPRVLDARNFSRARRELVVDLVDLTDLGREGCDHRHLLHELVVEDVVRIDQGLNLGFEVFPPFLLNEIPLRGVGGRLHLAAEVDSIEMVQELLLHQTPPRGVRARVHLVAELHLTEIDTQATHRGLLKRHRAGCAHEKTETHHVSRDWRTAAAWWAARVHGGREAAFDGPLNQRRGRPALASVVALSTSLPVKEAIWIRDRFGARKRTKSASKCTKVHQSAPKCIKVHRKCTKVHQKCIKVHQSAPKCTRAQGRAPGTTCPLPSHRDQVRRVQRAPT